MNGSSNKKYDTKIIKLPLIVTIEDHAQAMLISS